MVAVTKFGLVGKIGERDGIFPSSHRRLWTGIFISYKQGDGAVVLPSNTPERISTVRLIVRTYFRDGAARERVDVLLAKRSGVDSHR